MFTGFYASRTAFPQKISILIRFHELLFRSHDFSSSKIC